MNVLEESIEECLKATKKSQSISSQHEADIRDVGKKVQQYEAILESQVEKLQKSELLMEEAEIEFKGKEEDVGASSRRVLLMEEESTVSVQKLATTTMKLALLSKEADVIIKGRGGWEKAAMNNEAELETLDNGLKTSKKMGKMLLCRSESVLIHSEI